MKKSTMILIAWAVLSMAIALGAVVLLAGA